MAFCHQNGIHAGVTTNGSALNRKNAIKFVEAQPWNLNVSVDAPNAEMHDYLRGWPGLFQKLSDGIKYVREERDKRGLDFPIIIKPTIGKKNYKYLPEMVEWAKEIGATALNFQPMDRWTPETYDELWIEEDEHAELQKVVDTMLELKRKGEPIMNSDLVISLIVAHFREEKAPPEVMPCRVGLARFLHQDQRRDRSLLLLPLDRQYQGAVGPRNLVWTQGRRRFASKPSNATGSACTPAFRRRP